MNWPRNPDETVTVEQVATLYRVTAKTIRRWLKRGKIPPSDDPKRLSWRAGTIIKYKRAWELVSLVRRAARGHKPPADGHNVSSGGHEQKRGRNQAKDS